MAAAVKDVRAAPQGPQRGCRASERPSVVAASALIGRAGRAPANGSCWPGGTAAAARRLQSMRERIRRATFHGEDGLARSSHVRIEADFTVVERDPRPAGIAVARATVVLHCSFVDSCPTKP